MAVDMDHWCAQLIHIRDKRAELEKFDKELRNIEDLVRQQLDLGLQESNTNGAKTKHGVVYRNTRYSATVQDPEAFMRYIKENNMFDLIDRRANVTAVRAFVEERKTLPPGVNLNSYSQVGVRRAGEK